MSKNHPKIYTKPQNIGGGGVLYKNYRKLCILSIPSFCGIFVKRLVTSIDTRNVGFLTFVLSIKFMKSVVSVVSGMTFVT